MHRAQDLGTRIFNLILVAGSLTFSYPVLKYLQQGVWLVYPYHLEAFALFMISIYAVLQMGVLTLGFKKAGDRRTQSALRRFVSDPKFFYTAACIVLDILWATIQTKLVSQYPVEFRSVHPDTQHLSNALTRAPADLFTLTTFAVIVFSLTLISFNRRQALRVQDAIAWSDKNSVPASYALHLENTSLVKKALGLSNLAVVTWHAPDSVRGIGTSDLRTGSTFISPGRLHEEGLKRVGDNINLPDFWEAILHPDDFAGASDGLGQLLHGKTDTFLGKSRFRSPEGDWFIIRGHAKVEFSPINGLPIAFYGIHVDITDEAVTNDMLGETKVRQLHALRLIGHDTACFSSSIPSRPNIKNLYETVMTIADNKCKLS